MIKKQSTIRHETGRNVDTHIIGRAGPQTPTLPRTGAEIGASNTKGEQTLTKGGMGKGGDEVGGNRQTHSLAPGYIRVITGVISCWNGVSSGGWGQFQCEVYVLSFKRQRTSALIQASGIWVGGK